MSTAQAPPSSGRSVFKGAFQGTVIYSIPLIGQRVAGIFILSVVTRVLTTADMGMVSLLDQVSGVLSILLCNAFSSALGYFYFQKSDAADREKAVGTCLGGALLLGILGMAIFWPAMGIMARTVFRSEEALRYLPFALLCLPTAFLLEAQMGWLRVEDRQMAFARISVLRMILTVGGIGVLVGVFKVHVMAYPATTLAVQTAVCILLAIYLFRSMRPRFSTEEFIGMLHFAVPLQLSGIAMFVINFGDQFVLRHYRSFSEVGIYSLAYRLGMIVAVAYGAFQMYWNAQVYRIMRMDDAETVFARLFTYAVLLVSGITVVLTVCAKPGLHILVAPAFREAAGLVPLLAAANAIRSIAEFLRCRFLAAGRPGYDAWSNWIGLAVCVALYFWLIPWLGMWGGAMATAATFAAMFAISAAWTYRVKPYELERVRLLKLGVVLTVIGILYYAIPVESLVMQVVWSAVLVAMMPAGLCLLRFPTPGEWEAVRNVTGRVISWRYRAAAG
jgi:O-antigen/teichoic acid export membrane protein